MIILKLIFHIFAFFSKFFYKLIYGKKIKIGKSVTWRRKMNIMISLEGSLSIGSNCFFNNFCSLNCNSNVTIGDNCIFGEGVKIYDHDHRFSDKNKLIKDQGFSNGSVIIGKNCWIGSNVVILKNSKIGENCVIGAGCVIHGEIPDNTIVRNDSCLRFEDII